VSLALPIDETAMALTGPSRRVSSVVTRPRMRYNAQRRALHFNVQQFERSLTVSLDKHIALLTAADMAQLALLTKGFTSALPYFVVTWDGQSLHRTFAALSEDYDVAATDEATFSATKHFGW
jgi:hypothetical protein